MNDNLLFHQVSAEPVNDKHGPAIMLSQREDGYNEPDTVMLHPWQLRAICEHFGIIASDQQAARTIATLQRRMLVLRDRIYQLDDWITHHSDHRHADLSHEMASIGALADFAREWCADFEGMQEPIGKPSAEPSTAQETQQKPIGFSQDNPAQTQPAPVPQSPDKPGKVAAGQLDLNV